MRAPKIYRIPAVLLEWLICQPPTDDSTDPHSLLGSSEHLPLFSLYIPSASIKSYLLLRSSRKTYRLLLKNAQLQVTLQHQPASCYVLNRPECKTPPPTKAVHIRAAVGAGPGAGLHPAGHALEQSKHDMTSRCCCYVLRSISTFTFGESKVAWLRQIQPDNNHHSLRATAAP